MFKQFIMKADNFFGRSVCCIFARVEFILIDQVSLCNDNCATFFLQDEYVLQLQQHAFDMINFSHRPMDQALSPREPREMSRGSMEGSGQGLVELLSAYNTQ